MSSENLNRDISENKPEKSAIMLLNETEASAFIELPDRKIIQITHYEIVADNVLQGITKENLPIVARLGLDATGEPTPHHITIGNTVVYEDSSDLSKTH